MSRRPRSCLAALAALAGCATAPRFDGPMATRDQHPAQLTVARLEPRTAAVDPGGAVRAEWRNAYSSMFVAGRAGTSSFETDGELWRTSLAARVGLGGGFDLSAELPFGHASGGFLDGFVIEWHSIFGFPDQGREAAARDRVSLEATQDGAKVYEMEAHGLNLFDVPLVLSWAAVPIGADRPFGLLFRGGVELPTGDDARGFGSGDLDWTVGAVAEYRTGPVAWNAHVEHTWASTPAPAAQAGFEFRDVLSLGVGAEAALDDDWTLLGQVEMDQATLRDLDIARAASEQWILWTGLRVRMSERLRLEGGIGEDLSQFNAPDFSAWLTLAMDFGRP